MIAELNRVVLCLLILSVCVWAVWFAGVGDGD